ncbi:MAG TPA: protease complex subunit PrcB family protein [Verrucomicrobiae bacterium]|nr:protease complex subunit PrcB family protein [Verrucomicrobiae bacterium]
MTRWLLLIAGATLAGCGATRDLFARETPIEVREVGRSLYCNTPGETVHVTLLADAQAVADWQAARGIVLAGGESLSQAPHAVVEMGARPTGGYGIAVARGAALRGEVVVLAATFVSPPPGSIRTQALSSPCVLVQLPRGRYTEVEVRDPSGELRARGGRPQPGAPVDEPVPSAVPAS